MEDSIRANADLVIQELGPLSGLDFGFTTESIAWVDAFIERQRHILDARAIDRFVDTMGSFLGECVIRSFGGSWRQVSGEWCVYFEDGSAVFPFAKVRKQFMNGQADSIKGFFELVPVLFKQRLEKPEQPPVWDDGVKPLDFFVRLAEEAYDRMYEAHSSSACTAAYSDCKENMYEAIGLAQQLGLEQRVIELRNRLEHYKNVFRHQMT